MTLTRSAVVNACPVQALEDWLRSSDTAFGPVVRKVDRWGNVEHTRLGADAWHRILARRSGRPRPRARAKGTRSWLARSRRIDLARLSIAAMIEAFEDALTAALAAADWLQRRTQVGREVFLRGQADQAGASRSERTGDVTALLRACLAALRLPAEAATLYRVPGPPVWSVLDAAARIRRCGRPSSRTAGCWKHFCRLWPPMRRDGSGATGRRCRRPSWRLGTRPQREGDAAAGGQLATDPGGPGGDGRIQSSLSGLLQASPLCPTNVTAATRCISNIQSP